MNQAVESKIPHATEEQGADATVMPSDPSDDRQQRIATIAYYKAEARGFEPGYEMEDWLAAEAEIDASI